MTSAVIGSLRVSLGIDSAAFSDGLKQAGSRLAGFGATLRAAVVPVAAAGAAAFAGMGVAVRGVIDNADEMSKAAAKFGVPIEELSRLKYAADLSDVSLQGLGTSLGRLSRNMADAASGSKAQVEAFAAIGVAVTNSDGSLRSSSDVLQDLADRFAAMPDGAAKTAAAMELMGRSGAEMIPLLNGGSQALRDMMAEADSFGQVFSADMGAQAEQFNDNLTRLQGAFGNLAADLTRELLPYLSQFTEWLVRNGPALSSTAGSLVAFGAQVIYTGQQIAAFIKIAGDALVAGAQAVVGFMQTLANGFAQAVAAVQQFGADVMAALDAFGDSAAAAIDGVIASLGNLAAEMIQIGRDVVDGLLQGLQEKWESVKAWFTGLGDSIPQWVRDRLGVHSPSTVFAEIGHNIMDGLQVGLEGSQGQVESGMESFAGRIADTFSSILLDGADFKDAFQGLLASTLGNLGGGLIQDAFGAIGGAFRIPGFANGTRNAPPGLALVGERGPEVVRFGGGESVIPNRDLTGMMGGGTTKVELLLSPDLEARFLQQAGQQSVRIVGAGLDQANRGLPGRMEQAGKDPWRRG